MKGIEYLKGLGVQRVHEDTRITKKNLEAIFNKTYDEIHRVQFSGYVTLLEKEYGIDLSALREEYDTYCTDHDIKNSEKLFYSTSERKSKRGWLIPLIVIILIVFGYFVFNNLQHTESVFTLDTQENEAVESAINSIKNYKNEVVVVEESNTEDNTTVVEAVVVAQTDANETEEVQNSKEQQADTAKLKEKEEAKETPPPNAEKTLQNVLITPKRKVWIGYIDLDTKQKYQKMTGSELVLSGKKNWLIMFGHGFVTVQNGDTYFNMDSMDRVRFAYLNGELKEITKEMFANMNEGKAW